MEGVRSEWGEEGGCEGCEGGCKGVREGVRV